MTFAYAHAIIITVRGKPITISGQDGKGEYMEQEMNTGEEIEKLAKENRTWEILEILRECKDLEEAKERVKALLSK